MISMISVLHDMFLQRSGVVAPIFVHKNKSAKLISPIKRKPRTVKQNAKPKIYRIKSERRRRTYMNQFQLKHSPLTVFTRKLQLLH